jgi:spore coat polysaccharide biosynthesis predicted glycosyltransferase SpsG
MNKKNVNLLCTVPKQEIHNLKNLHVVTHSGASEDNYSETNKSTKERPKIDLDPDEHDKLMREAKIFQTTRPR